MFTNTVILNQIKVKFEKTLPKENPDLCISKLLYKSASSKKKIPQICSFKKKKHFNVLFKDNRAIKAFHKFTD